MHSDALKEILLPLETSLRDIAEIAVSEADADKLKKDKAFRPGLMTLISSSAGRRRRFATAV